MLFNAGVDWVVVTLLSVVGVVSVVFEYCSDC